MPIYEYLCAECAHTLDALQRLSDEALVFCPQCGAAALKRQMSAPSFRLKGGGWYETDFKNDKRRNISESDSAAGEGKPAEAKAEGKSAEGKPAETKAEGKGQDGKPKDGKSAEKRDATPAKGEKAAASPSGKGDGGASAAKKPDTGKAGGVA
jgi:putative FmdB family regulatory protein